MAPQKVVPFETPIQRWRPAGLKNKNSFDIDRRLRAPDPDRSAHDRQEFLLRFRPWPA